MKKLQLKQTKTQQKHPDTQEHRKVQTNMKLINQIHLKQKTITNTQKKSFTLTNTHIYSLFHTFKELHTNIPMNYIIEGMEVTQAHSQTETH